MLQDRTTKIFSEIGCFFTVSEKAIKKVMELYSVVKIDPKKFYTKSNWPVEFDRGDLLLSMLLMPLYSVKNVKQYLSSALYPQIEAGKDTLYRFKNNENVNWRKLAHSINKRILKKIKKSGQDDASSPKCLIILAEIQNVGNGIYWYLQKQI